METEVAPGLARMAKAALKKRRIPEKAMRAFVISLAELCPHFMGGKPEYFGDTSIKADALLSRVIMALDYTPSSIDALADHDSLTRAGIIEDVDLPRMTVRQMTDHCTVSMLREIEKAAIDHESKLVTAAAAVVEPTPAQFEEPKTEIIDHPLLGPVEVDSATGQVLRVVPIPDGPCEIMVDDTAQVIVDLDAETAKQSNVWGSW